MPTSGQHVRIAALADLHCTHPTQPSRDSFHQVLVQVGQVADVLALCGDLTDYGLAEEAQTLAKEFASLKLPIVAVLGNHDYESDQQQQIKHIFADAGVTVLDGEATEIAGIGFAGTKGFGGGFGRGTLASWGERTTKAFVQEALDEAVKLESALARLQTPHRIVLLHYAPIRGTVEGEPLEIFPFLGCGRLEEPLNRYQVTAVVHGHAHHGSPEAKTSTGVPVYNVSVPLMRRTYPDRPPFRVLDIPVASAKAEPTRAGPPVGSKVK